MTGKKSCPRCLDLRYITYCEGPRAQARKCDCAVSCTVCGGIGLVIRGNGPGAIATPCDCVGLSHRINLFNQANIPSKFRNDSFETYQTFDKLGKKQGAARYELLSLAKRFTPGERGIILVGNPGVGKTHLITSFIRTITLERAVPAKFIEFMDLLAMIRDAYQNRKSDLAILHPLMTAPVLAIDEIGKGKNSDWENSVLDYAISHRYNNGLSTFGTTNYRIADAEMLQSMRNGRSVEAETEPSKRAEQAWNRAQQGFESTLMERLGPRFLSRMYEMCRFVEVDGPDHRMLDDSLKSDAKKLR